MSIVSLLCFSPSLHNRAVWDFLHPSSTQWAYPSAWFNLFAGMLLPWRGCLHKESQANTAEEAFYRNRAQTSPVFRLLHSAIKKKFHSAQASQEIIQLLYFWTLSIVVLFKTHNVSETGFCLRLHVQTCQFLIELVPISSPMDNVEKHNNFINLPSSQTFTSYLWTRNLGPKHSVESQFVCWTVHLSLILFSLFLEFCRRLFRQIESCSLQRDYVYLN
jgi:hypothetical protein